MKINYHVSNPSACRTQFHQINLPGYYNTEEVIRDLDRVLELHELRYEKYKAEYIAKWGQAQWDINANRSVDDAEV